MNISIITIFNIHNFGSVFQAYALREYLDNCGHDTKVIDYTPKYFRKKSIRNLIGQLINLKEYVMRKNKYENFIKKNIRLTNRKYYSFNDLDKYKPIADIYIAGGDQLWNSYHECGKDDSYKLLFVKGRKISYGTSMGRDNFEKEELQEIKYKLKDFKKISVRESSSVTLLKSVGLNNVVQVVDPVLLLEKDKYFKFISKTAIEKYVFVYLVQESEILDKTVEYISQKLDLKVVLYAGFSKKCKCDYFLKDLGPDEVLSYIKNADFVISASFHATLFSIIFHKQFVTLLPDKNTNERIQDLLSWTNLKNRIIKNSEDLLPYIFDKISYEEIDLIIKDRRDKSINFLSSSLYS